MVRSQELGKYVEQYTGYHGSIPFTVKVLRIGEKANEEALIQISGVDDTLDGKIYKYKKEWQNSDTSLNKFIYVTNEIPGEVWYGILHSDSNWGNQTLTVYLYDTAETAIRIWPKETPVNLDPYFMYTNYRKQLEHHS